MKDRILEKAQDLFFAKGYHAVSLASICTPLKIKPASLYYHFKGGKEELYLEVIKRRTLEFKSQVESLALRHSELEKILKQFGYWYVEQPAMNMMIIAQIDMPYLTPRAQKILNEQVSSTVFEPLGLLFMRNSSLLRTGLQPFSLVGTFSVLLFSIHDTLKMGGGTPRAVVDYNVDLFLRGALAK